jgi:hypothetical protein
MIEDFRTPGGTGRVRPVALGETIGEMDQEVKSSSLDRQGV